MRILKPVLVSLLLIGGCLVIVMTSPSNNVGRQSQLSQGNTRVPTIQSPTYSPSEAAGATSEYVAKFKSIDPRELASYADKHVGEDVVVRGRVFNILDDQNLQIYVGSDNDNIYVQLANTEHLDGIYKGDKVVVYGTVFGTREAKNLLGIMMRLPVLMNATVTKS